MCWNSWTSVSARVTGSGGQDVARAPNADGLVAVIRSVSECGVSGTMTATLCRARIPRAA